MTNNNIHPSHDHGLVKDDKCEGSYKCSGCKMRGIGKRYRCTESCCKFELHLECMQAEEKRKFLKQKFRLHTNPLQRPECTNEGGKCWSCDACGKKVRGFVYHCSETHQVFHPLCFPKLEYHPFHDHGLVKDDKCEGSYKCSGCKMKGIGKRYRCSESCCKFELHLECMHAKEKRKFLKQKFRLHTNPLQRPECTNEGGKCWSCDACGKKVRGFVYHCSETHQVFHPLCFPKLEYHPFHDHGLVKDDKCEGNYTCSGCKMRGIGKRYRCSESCCKFELHLECMHAEEKRTFQKQKLRLYKTPPPGCSFPMKDFCTECRCCNVCGEMVRGFVYHCSETNQDFHPPCTKLPSKVRIDDVTFLLKDEGPSSCAFCEKKTPRGKKITGWSYVSKLHKRGFHVCCAVNMISKEDSSLSLAGIENLHLLCKCKNGSTQSRSNWLIILKIFSKVVFSICLGDPAAIIFSAIDLLIN